MKETKVHWIDENNNKWKKKYFSKERAIKNSNSLTNCTNCIDCSNCTNCTNCIDCSNCTNCKNCTACNICEDCANCKNCTCCLYCNYCKRCTNLVFLTIARARKNLNFNNTMFCCFSQKINALFSFILYTILQLWYNKYIKKGDRKMKIKDVDFVKGQEYFMGETKNFWRGDYKGQTIATLCRTKQECVDEVRRYIKRQNSK